MSDFRSELLTRLYDEQRGLDQLAAPFAYYSSLLKCEIVVPEGFITDWASVPRMPLAYMVVGGKGKRAALVHDWLYKSQIVPRGTADAIFKEALEASGYGALVQVIFWVGVRAGGWVAWRKHARENSSIEQPEHVQVAMDEWDYYQHVGG